MWSFERGTFFLGMKWDRYAAWEIKFHAFNVFPVLNYSIHLMQESTRLKLTAGIY